jgi:hypothetical protein
MSEDDRVFIKCRKNGFAEIIGFYYRPLLEAAASEASALASRASPAQG